MGNGHDYATDPLWLNVWFDLNFDCIWATPGERVVNVGLSPPVLAGPNATNTVLVVAPVPLPPIAPEPMWVRARLDWGEDAGAAANIDGTLANTEGAAQFGEVEDYQLWCENTYRQQWAQNTTGLTKNGMALVVTGNQLDAGASFNAEVDQNDCVLTRFGEPAAFYDAAENATTFQYLTPVPHGKRRHTGRCQPDQKPLGLLRAYWMSTTSEPGAPGASQSAGPVAIGDRLPSTNVAYCPTPYGVRVQVGAVNSTSGGWIAQGASYGQWIDSLTVSVSYRLVPYLVPLENLSPCDPLLVQWPSVPVGGGTVTPDRPYQFDIPLGNLVQGMYLVIETVANWSANPNTCREVIEFTQPVHHPTAVRRAVELPRDAFALAVAPNPIVHGTSFRYVLGHPARVRLAVFDLAGRLVRSLERDVERDAGIHTVAWDGRDAKGERVPSGVYLARLDAGGRSTMRRLIVTR